MRAQIAKTGYLPPSIYEVHFDSYPLPLLRRFIVGAAIEKNFFYFSDFVLDFYFFSDFARIHRMFGLRIFFLFLLFDLYSFYFLFFQNPNFNSISFARYLLVCDSRIRF